jgi:hypothetical protein
MLKSSLLFIQIKFIIERQSDNKSINKPNPGCTTDSTSSNVSRSFLFLATATPGPRSSLPCGVSLSSFNESSNYLPDLSYHILVYQISALPALAPFSSSVTMFLGFIFPRTTLPTSSTLVRVVPLTIFLGTVVLVIPWLIPPTPQELNQLTILDKKKFLLSASVLCILQCNDLQPNENQNTNLCSSMEGYLVSLVAKQTLGPS